MAVMPGSVVTKPRGRRNVLIGLLAAVAATLLAAPRPAFLAGGTCPGLSTGRPGAEAVLMRAKAHYRFTTAKPYRLFPEYQRRLRNRQELRRERRFRNPGNYNMTSYNFSAFGDPDMLGLGLSLGAREVFDFNKLPGTDDIYHRQYTGDGATDPIGGRKKTTIYFIFKKVADKQDPKEEVARTCIKLKRFLETKMSARDLVISEVKDPRKEESFGDIATNEIELEYPMRQYGDWNQRIQRKPRPLHNQGYLVKFDMLVPAEAIDYIEKRIYSDPMILRWSCMSHTINWNDYGEDNELFL